MEDANKYRIGQILIANSDFEIDRGFLWDKITIPKGGKVIVGADDMAYYIDGTYPRVIAKNANAEGYDPDGIANYLYNMLKSEYGIDYYLQDIGRTSIDFMYSIKKCLEAIGFKRPCRMEMNTFE